MKSILFSLSICLGFFDAAVSQNPIEKTSLYFLAGPSYLNTRGIVYNTSIQKVTKIGYSAGLGITHYFGEHFSLNGRFLLEKKGNRTNYDLYSYSNNSPLAYLGTIDEDLSNSYITITAIPQFVFGKFFSVGVGLYFSELYKSTQLNRYYNWYPPVPPSRYNLIHALDNFDCGLAFNVGYTLPFRHVIFTLQLTNNYGLKSVPNSNQVPPWYNNTYSILLGIGYDKVTNRIFKKLKIKIKEI